MLSALTERIVEPRQKYHRGKAHHQYKHGQFNSPIYNAWCRMKKRCLNPNDVSYERYGAKGVQVCEAWMTFENFYDDMRDSWFEGATLDRIDSTKGYEPRNCRWVTKAEQNRNKSSVRLYWYRGAKRTIPEIAAMRGMNAKTLYNRLVRLEWPLERAVSLPASYGNRYAA